MTFQDPPVPPEAGEARLRAKELKNRVVVLRATGTGQDDTKPDSAGRPWTWVECDCWVIDRSGVEIHETNLRVSWWRVMEQLKAAMGQFVAGRVTEQEDNSIILAPVQGAAREVITEVMPEIVRQSKASVDHGSLPTTDPAPALQDDDAF